MLRCCSIAPLLATVGDSSSPYSQAIRLQPDYAIAWNNLAGVIKGEGDLPTATQYFREVSFHITYNITYNIT